MLLDLQSLVGGGNQDETQTETEVSEIKSETTAVVSESIAIPESIIVEPKQAIQPRIFVKGGLNLTWLPTSGYSFSHIESDLMKSVYAHWYQFVEAWTATVVTSAYGIPAKYVVAVQSIMDEIVLRNEVRLQTSQSGTIYSVKAGGIVSTNKVVDDFVDTFGRYGGSAYQLGNDAATDFVAGIDEATEMMSFDAVKVDERGSHYGIFGPQFLGTRFVGRKNGYSFDVIQVTPQQITFKFATEHDVSNPLFLEDFAHPAIFDALPLNKIY